MEKRDATEQAEGKRLGRGQHGVRGKEGFGTQEKSGGQATVQRTEVLGNKRNPVRNIPRNGPKGGKLRKRVRCGT